MNSPAAAAKGRVRAAPSLQTPVDSDCDDHESGPQVKRLKQTSMGKAKPKGSRLARGMVQAGELLSQSLEMRTNSIAGRKAYRKTESWAAELPTGTVDVQSKPSRRDPKYEAGDAGEVLWQSDLQEWEQKNIAGCIRQQRTDANYEKAVGLINSWINEQGHLPFAKWHIHADGLASLDLIETEDADGKRSVRTPSVEQTIAWMYAKSTGEAPKGGSKEYRSGPWYAPIRGVAQGEMLGAAKVFGFGPYANEPPQFISIEQAISKLRQWLAHKLQHYPGVPNPMHNVRIKQALARLEQSCGRHRVEKRLPRTITEDELKMEIATAHVTKETAGVWERSV